MSRKPTLFWVAFAVALITAAGFIVAVAIREPTPPQAPVEVKLGPIRTSPQVSVGGIGALFVAPDGTLWACGASVGPSRPQQVDTNTDWVAVIATGVVGFALREDGSLWEFGGYSFGAFGPALFGPGGALPPLNPVVPGAKWISVISGNGHTLGIQADGSLWGWGWNEHGELGIPPENHFGNPVRIGSDTNWVSVAAAEETSVGVKTDGTLWHWGVIGRTKPLPSHPGSWRITQPTPLRLGPETNWRSAESTLFGVVCRKTDGTYWIIGQTNGALAANPNQTNTPVPFGIGRGLASMALSWDTSYAVKEDGTLWAWRFRPGADTNLATWTFQSGLGAKLPSLRRVGWRKDWVCVWSGGDILVGLTKDGQVWTWGRILGAELFRPPTRLEKLNGFLEQRFGFSFERPRFQSPYGGTGYRFPSIRKPWVIMRFVTNGPPGLSGEHPHREQGASSPPP